jgi:hypothetical protein
MEAAPVVFTSLHANQESDDDVELVTLSGVELASSGPP